MRILPRAHVDLKSPANQPIVDVVKQSMPIGMALEAFLIHFVTRAELSKRLPWMHDACGHDSVFFTHQPWTMRRPTVPPITIAMHAIRAAESASPKKNTPISTTPTEPMPVQIA